MAKPFANAQQYNGTVEASHIMGIQIGISTDDAGLAQMRYISLDKLRAFFREGMGSAFNYRGEYSSIPTDLATNDTFYASTTFTEDGQTFTQGHLYSYNANGTWDDITDIFSQYAKQGQVDEIDQRLTQAEAEISAFAGGIVFKGETTSANLPAPDASNKGWMYFVTDLGKYQVSDGTQWVDFGSYPIESYALRSSFPVTGEGQKIYIAEDEEKLYWWDGNAYVSDLDHVEREIENVNDRVTSNSKRISNLEDKSAPFTIDYPDADYGDGEVPAHIKQSADTKLVEGETRAWNSLINNSSLSTSTDHGVTFTKNADGSWTLSGTATGGDASKVISQTLYPTVGHDFLTFGCPQGGSPTTYMLYGTGGSGFSDIGSGQISHISSATTTVITILIREGVNATGLVFKPTLRDMTLILPDWNPADIVTANIPNMVKQIPDLLKYDAYGYSTITPLATGMEHTGVNKWDEVIEFGSYDTTTGEPTPTTTMLRAKNLVKVLPSTQYYCEKGGSGHIWALFYDINGVLITGYSTGDGTTNNASQIDNTIFTTPQNCSYVKFYLTSGYGTTYNQDVQIALNSLPDSVKKTYHPYNHSEIEFSEPVPLNGINDVKQIFNPSTGEGNNPIGSKLITELEFTKAGNIFYALLPDAKPVSSSYDVANILCARFIPTSRNAMTAVGQFSLSSSGSIKYINFYWDDVTIDAFKTAMDGVLFFYELDTPTTESVTPSPTALNVEPYGDITVRQSQSVKLPLGFSMQYIPDSPYLTKSDVVDNLTSSATDKPLSANQGRILNETIARQQKEIDNLKQTSGEVEVTVSYPDDANYPSLMPNRVHADSADFAEVGVIKAKVRAWNQLIHAITSSPQTNNATINSFSDGVATFTASAYRGMVYYSKNYNPLPTTSGKVLLIAIKVKTTTATDQGRLYCYGGYVMKGIVATTNWQTVYKITTTNASWGNDLTNNNQICFEDLRTENWDAIQVTKPMCRDLSLIAPEFTPSGDENADMAYLLQRFPDLLTWDDMYADGGNGYGFVKAVVDGVTSKGFNLWNEEWELGYYDLTTGQPMSASTLIRSKSSSPISVCPTQSLCIHVRNGAVLMWYDADGNYLSYTAVNNNAIIQVPINAHLLKFHLTNSYGTTYTHDICINISNPSLDGTYKSWREPDILSISPASSGNSAGSAYDTDELCVEVSKGVFKRRQTQRVGSVDLSTLTLSYEFATVDRYNFTTTELASVIKKAAFNVDIGNGLCGGGFTMYSAIEIYGSVQVLAIGWDINGKIRMYIPNKTGADLTDGHALWLEGVTFYYELASESVTLLDPIINNWVQVEPGGTVETNQTQETKIDNSLDVNYDLIA